MKRDLHEIDHNTALAGNGWRGTPFLAGPSVETPLPAAAATDPLVSLMERIARGERDAFRDLYTATSPRLLASATRLVRNAAAAEDVVQETYMRVWRYSRSYRPTHSAPMTWINQIMRNRAIDIRAYGRAEEVALAEENDGDSPGDESGATAPLLAAAPLTPGEAGLSLSFDQLGGVHRQVLALAYHRGMSHAEIAEHLGVPLGTAKTWVRRALIALRASLAPGAPGQPSPEDLAP